MPRSLPSPAGMLLAVCLAAACLASAQAAHLYTGPDSFISSFDGVPAINLPGASLKLITGKDIFGLGLSKMSALLITLDPCTVLQPHIHPHAEFNFVISGAVTQSVVYNNGTLTSVSENTKKGVSANGVTVFPEGQLHVTQNEGCSKATVLAVFPVSTPDLYFFPQAEASLPANTIASFFGGRVSAKNLAMPVGTTKLAKCRCN